MKKQIDIRFWVILAFTIAMGVWRVTTASTELSKWAVFTPIGAMALFGGAYFTQKHKAYCLPILILFVSDFILMHTIYAEYRSGWLYEQWYWTYGSFLVMVWIGGIVIKRVNVTSVLLGSVLAALAHFVLSNFGVWLKGGMDFITGLPYAKNWSGLINCYLAAIPYFKNMILGNLVYGTLFFGTFEWAQRRFLALSVQPGS